MDWETDARFRCPECDKDVAVNVPLPEPPPTAEEINFSGGDIVIVTCSECGNAFKARVYVSPGTCSMEFIDHKETHIDASPPMVRDVYDDDWYYDTPPDPYGVFNASMAEARMLLDQHGGDGASLVNRMVFVHYIGALEAFLADTLINEVLPDEDALKKLIQGDEWLRSKRFSLTEIAASPDLIKDTVRERLRLFVWHRVKKANTLYRIAVGVDFHAMLTDKDSEIIDQAVQLRHDCVHRSGRDKDGVSLTAFTKDYVIGVGGILSRLVHDIVQALNTRRAQKWFAPPAPM